MPGRTIGAVDILVGQRLRAARLAKDMSQAALGQAIGITFQQIQKYEIGKHRVGTGRLHAMAEVLGVPVSYFFEGAKSSDPTATMARLTEALSTKEGVRIAACLARIRDRNLRRRIADLLEEIIANETTARKVAE